jgi:hypothetical protein
MKSRLRIRPLLLLAAILLYSTQAAAQYREPYDDDIRQSVARVSYFQGEVSFERGDAPNDWQPAAVNYPMTFGDRIWSGRDGRVEIQLRGATVYVAPLTELAALDLTRDVQQLSLSTGTASFRIARLDRYEVFEVATPNVSVTFETPGVYRIDVDRAGNSRVSVSQGRAWAAAAGGQVALERGEQFRVWGVDRPDYDVVRLARPDSWDRWVESRVRRYASYRSASYVHADIYGAYDLDAYGSWENHVEYGSVWYPRGVSAGWEPYRSGRWIWRDPWGWTWLSSEPWGWAPYHYGRWAVVRNRWCWIPVGPRDRYPGYSPAIVGFVGGGAGWSLSLSVGGFVGWFPLGPREPFDPWWHRSRSSVNVTGYNYAYRDRVTVVALNVFVGSGRVDRAVVQDTRVVRDVSMAQVVRGPIPILPTRESIRVAPVEVQGRTAARPPETVSRREVVTRTAPPQAPPTFERNLATMRERGGAPVPVDIPRRPQAEDRRGDQGVQPVRPAARGEVQLAPRGEVPQTRRPQPLPPAATRQPATPGRPAPEPEVRNENVPPGRGGAPPARVPDVRNETAPPPGRGAAAPAPAPEVRNENVPPGRGGAPPARAPQAPNQTEPTPTAAAPRRVDIPEAQPGRANAPAPQPRLTREPAPIRPAPEAAAGRGNPTKTEPESVEQKGKAPTRASSRAKPTPTPKGGKKDKKDSPDNDEDPER